MSMSLDRDNFIPGTHRVKQVQHKWSMSVGGGGINCDTLRVNTSITIWVSQNMEGGFTWDSKG